jgi:hypothetical protein
VIGAPGSGSQLGTVSGTGAAATCTTLPCTFTMSANSTVSVEFTGSGSTGHTLSVTKTGSGSGTVECKIAGGAAGPCPSSVEDGESVEVIGAPGSGSQLGTVSGTGAAATCTTLPCTFTMSSNGSVSVEFKGAAVVNPKLGITKTGTGSGTVRCNAGAGFGECATEYVAGTHVTLSAVPLSGSGFTGWSGGGCSGTGVCTITIESDTSIVASFDLLPSGGGGDNGGGGGGGNTGGGNTGGGGGSTGGSSSGGSTTKTGGSSGGEKTPAQKLKEKRQKAIAKCKKLKGKAKASCMKKANQIGKPKKKPKKKTAQDLVRVASKDTW